MQIVTRGTLTATIVVLGVGLAGCEHVIGGGVGVVSATSECTRTYQLDEGGEVGVTNIKGRIAVEPSEGATVEVHAERTGKGMSQEAAEAALAQLEIEEDVSSDHVRLQTRTSDAGFMGMGGGEVDYTLRVPVNAQVRLRSVNGRIRVAGIHGRVEAETTNGRINGEGLSGAVDASATNGRVEMDMDAVAEGGIRIETTNGRIRLLVPQAAQANISARLGNGSIETSGLSLPPDGESGRRRLESALNGGGPEIELRTANGSITIEGKS